MKSDNLNDFYLFCDADHRELYSVLLRDWQEIGLAWQCEKRELLLGVSSTIRDEFFTCFSLCTSSVSPSSIRIDMSQWRTHLGQEDTADFIRDISAIQGLKHEQRGSCFIIESPAHALFPIQKALRNLMHQLAVVLPNKVAA